MNELTEDERTKFNEWVNSCQWTCLECNYQTISNSSYYSHLAKIHSLVSPEEHEKNGKAAITLKNHKCRLCENSIRHHSAQLRRHLKRIHEIDAESLGTQYTEGILNKVAKQSRKPMQDERVYIRGSKYNLHEILDKRTLNPSFRQPCQYGPLRKNGLSSRAGRDFSEKNETGSKLWYN